MASDDESYELFRRTTSGRWKGKLRDHFDYRKTLSEDRQLEQCIDCSFYVPLRGPLGSDWGACANERSEFDGRIMFEHLGCDAFERGKT